MDQGNEARSARRGVTGEPLPFPPSSVPARSPTVQEWANGLRLSQTVHHLMAERCAKRNKRLGVPAVILTAVVGTALFATVEDNPSNVWRIAAGLLSVTAGVLVSLQTFLAYDARERTHRTIASRYADLRRILEQERLSGEVRNECLTHIRERWCEIDGAATPTPERLRARALKKIKEDAAAKAQEDFD